jgi:hypothetical protein
MIAVILLLSRRKTASTRMHMQFARKEWMQKEKE